MCVYINKEVKSVIVMHCMSALDPQPFFMNRCLVMSLMSQYIKLLSLSFSSRNVSQRTSTSDRKMNLFEKKGAKNENHIFYFENEKSTKHVLRRNRIGALSFSLFSFFFPERSRNEVGE